MNLRVCSVLLLLLPCLVGVDLLRATNKNVAQGNAKLLDGQAKEALELYDKALAQDGLSDQEERAAAEFNRGAALSALNQHDEAAQAFLEATKSKEVSLRARAFYNLGNTFFRGEKFSEAVEAYKRSLVLDPKIADSKWNLELAQRRKREQDEKKEQNKDKNNQDKNNQDKNDQDKNDQDKNNQDKNNQDKNDQDKNDQGKNDQDKNDQDKNDQDKNDQDKNNQDKNDPQNSDKADSKPQNDPNEAPGEQDQPKPEEPGQDQSDKPESPSPASEQETKDQPAEPPAAQNQGAESPAGRNNGSAEMKEINAILDSLEQSPQEIEQQRARMRAVRRRAPVKDW